jgi:L-asparaginase II
VYEDPDPVLVEVVRGRRVESRHRGAVAVVDTTGRTLLSLGDVDAEILARSALKPFQALPLVESGAADAFGLDDRHLAIAQGSHTGDERHRDTVAELLAAAGITVDALACGPQDDRAGGPLGNNCSGKHAGFLAVARHLGVPLEGYVTPDHPVQQSVRAAIEHWCGAPCTGPVVDGCSAPAWAVPLRAIALGIARFGAAGPATPAGLLVHAGIGEPWALAGPGRAVTGIVEAGDGRVYAKSGAEGVMVAAVPDAGIGVAVKIADGAARAAEVVTATVLPRFVPGLRLDAFARPAVRTWAGAVVGGLRPSLLL